MGCSRFLDLGWSLQGKVIGGESYRPEAEVLVHQTIKKVTLDIDALKGNTAVAQLMTLTNRFYELDSINKAELKSFLLLLNPFAPHISEEIWERQGYPGVITDQAWPAYDEAKTQEDMVEIALQINGRIKARIDIPRDLGQEEAIELACQHPQMTPEIEGKKRIKAIYVPGRLVNIVVAG